VYFPSPSFLLSGVCVAATNLALLTPPFLCVHFLFVLLVSVTCFVARD
jgi:hypothetical protein